jgi:Tol biopolymer transport system component
LVGESFNRHVAVIKSDGTGFMDLTPGLEDVSSLEWSPDGTRLAFISQERLMVVNADGSGLDTLAYNPDLHDPAWSPDGQRIAYFAGADVPRTLNNDRGIWTVKPDGTGHSKILNVLPGFGTYRTLQFSPDGQKIAMCHGTNSAYTIEVMNANGTGRTTLPLECHSVFGGPQWSPDGSRILDLQNGNIYTIAPDGGSAVQLTLAGDYELPRWSRQGTKIAFVHYEPSAPTSEVPLYVMSASGSSKKKLSPAGFKVEYLSWGP